MSEILKIEVSNTFAKEEMKVQVNREPHKCEKILIGGKRDSHSGQKQDFLLRARNDTLCIKVNAPKGPMGPIRILPPEKVDVTFVSGPTQIIVSPTAGRPVLTIPGGPGPWELLIKYPSTEEGFPVEDNVTIGDIEREEGDI
ncbi:MAG: hypothetical protein GY950_20910 [bacterium]|nr:hypothetical protein [bacterium]